MSSWYMKPTWVTCLFSLPWRHGSVFTTTISLSLWERSGGLVDMGGSLVEVGCWGHASGLKRRSRIAAAAANRSKNNSGPEAQSCSVNIQLLTAVKLLLLLKNTFHNIFVELKSSRIYGDFLKKKKKKINQTIDHHLCPACDHMTPAAAAALTAAG